MPNLAGPTGPVITLTEALTQLAKILASKEFAGSPRLSRFLRCVVEETLAGNAAALKEYKIGRDVFDRSEDFDPRVDAVVRVEARQVRFKLASYYGSEGSADTLIVSLPKGGYAARFERTIEIGGEATEDSAGAADPETLTPVRTWSMRRIAAAAALLAVGAVGAGMASLWFRSPDPTSHSVAVLPFTNLSADPANQYFSDGLTDEITGELSRVKNLRVIARASAFQFRGNRVDLHQVGQQLHVSNILEGSVERFGDHVKIVAHLERVSDGSHLWANTYERKTSDLFTVQSELAAAIAANLNATLAPASRPVVRDVEAHDAFMRARYNLERGSPAAVLQAQADFQKAIDCDPFYAEAYAGLGSARFGLGAARFNNKWTDQKGSEEMWRKALTLDPTIEQAHSGLALLAMQYDWDWATAEREVKAALAAGPSARAELRYATILAPQRRFDEAAQHLLRSEELDPLGPALLLARGQTWLYLKRFDRAQSELQKALSQHPEMSQAQFGMSRIEAQEGHLDLALARLRKLPQTPPLRVVAAWMTAAQGHRAEALQMIHAEEENYQTGDVPMAAFGVFYASIDDVSTSMKWLNRSADRHEWPILWLAVEPWYDRMRSDPGFRALKERVHLPD